MNGFLSVFKRELIGYFSTPVAYLFLVIFLALSAFMTFQNNFFEIREASLRLFFEQMPLIFIFFVPAIAMRLWAEEKRSNSIELLFTLPITTMQAALGKFMAAWIMIIIALLLTFPMIIMISILGDPDPGPIITGYIACVLLSGSFLAIGSFCSSMTSSQVIAFVMGVVICAIMLYAGSPAALNLVSTIMPMGLIEVLESLSIQTNYESLLSGMVSLHVLLFYAVLIVVLLIANVLVLEERRASR